MNLLTPLTLRAQRMAPGLIAVALLASAMGAAQAAYLVDTGAPNIEAGYVGLSNYTMDEWGFQYTSQQYLAASFDITSASTITSLGAYMYNNGSGAVTFELHQGTPTGALVYSGTVSSVGGPDYYTLSGLNLDVAAGAYSLNLVVSNGFDGGLYIGAPGLPDALTASYVSNDASNWWLYNTSYGIQVGGTAGGATGGGGATGVPAPLPLLGVVGAFAWSRKLRGRIKRATTPAL